MGKRAMMINQESLERESMERLSKYKKVKTLNKCSHKIMDGKCSCRLIYEKTRKANSSKKNRKIGTLRLSRILAHLDGF